MASILQAFFAGVTAISTVLLLNAGAPPLVSLFFGGCAVALFRLSLD